ncbi:hypothetical protein [Leptolyngbya sp. AN10]|uniref:isopeptide-forming domain-containing fimbrial protein n=1 Tax=Leptolyngbya sp. AN10 TaxID=3423365 RepID=UPI003D31910F
MNLFHSNFRDKVCRKAYQAFGLFLISLICTTLLSLPSSAAVVPFSIRYQTNDTGDIVYVANTLMTCPSSNTSCDAARNGTFTGGQNNGFTMTYVDIDSDATTFNSSSSDLNLPSGATVLFAGLYWGGDSSNAARNQVRLKTPTSSGYLTITANASDVYGNIGYQNAYQGFADITSTVKANGNGTYTVANVQSTSGSTNRWAGWTIVVVYRSPGEPVRNLTVFDGFNVVSGSNPTINIPISGFKTPPFGTIYAKLGAIAYDGDNGVGITGSSYTGDRFRLNGSDLSNPLNPANDVFNSSITYLGTRITTKFPDYPNQLGYDSDIFNVSSVLNNNATTATLTLNTGGETYMPGVVTSSIQIFAPILEVNKTVADLNGGDVDPGDTLEYTISVANKQDADGNGDLAVKSILEDAIPANTAFVPGSIEINGVSKTDAIADDEAFFDSATQKVTYRIGTGATATSGGTLSINETNTVRFRVTININAAPGTTISNQANASFEAQNLPGTVLSGSSNAANIVIRSAPASTPPEILLVKRITAINNVSFNDTVDDPSSTNDNAPNWALPLDATSGISTFLRGRTQGGTVRPGDIIEYTIYFLSTGGRDATNVSLCDLVPANSTFVTDRYNGFTPTDGGLPGDSGIALSIGSNTPTAYLTNQIDLNDRGRFIPAGNSTPTSCIGTNTDGAVVVDVTKSPAMLPKATGPGTPTNSYGFIRFHARVD